MNKTPTEEKKAQDFENEHISFKMTRSPGSQVTLEMVVKPEATKAAYARAMKAVNKEVSLPGFRKGKAPDDIIANKYAKPLRDEWLQIVLKTALNDALKIAHLRPFDESSIRCTEVKELSKENGAIFTIHFEASPEVPTIDLDKIHLHRLPTPPITEKDVDQVIRNIQHYHAEWNEISDRPVQEGDFVDLDIENIEEEPSRPICEGTRFEVKKGIMADWMHQLLLGVKIDESVEGISEKEEDSQNHFDEEEEEGLAEFRPTRCRLTVKTILHAELPAVDDAFAQKVGAKDLEDLKEKIKADLFRRADMRINNILHKQLDDAILKEYTFDPPNSLVQEEVENRAAAHEAWLRRQQKSEEEIENEMQELREKLPSMVASGLRIVFLMLRFAQEHSLSVAKEEIMAELSQQVSQGAQLNNANIDDLKARINQVLLMRKAKSYIINHLLPRS